MTEVAPAFDSVRLIADVRAGKPEAIAEAYAITFGSDLGRLVLLHHLQMSGVGRQLGVENLKYAAGMIDGAISLATVAGYDQVLLAATILTDQLEETPNAHAQYNDPSEEDQLDTFD